MACKLTRFSSKKPRNIKADTHLCKSRSLKFLSKTAKAGEILCVTIICYYIMFFNVMKIPTNIYVIAIIGTITDEINPIL